MALTFQPITLDSGTDDDRAMLVLNDGRLVAVLTCLSDMHGDLAGRWFVEAAFRQVQVDPSNTVEELEQVQDWVKG